jgi:hypothetical protein
MLVLLFCFSTAKGQVNPGARFTGMGNTGTALQDVSSLSTNPAGIANLKSPIIGLGFEEVFLGVDIQSQHALAVFPTRLGVLGYAVHNYGISNVYSSLKSGLSMAKMFGPQLAMAITINYHRLQIPSYGSDNTFSVEFGVQYIIKEKWIIGAHIDNPGRFGFQSQDYYTIPTVLRLGNSYQFSDQVLISIDSKYYLNKNFDGSLGLEYSLIEWLKLRGGISVNHFQRYIGFGFGRQSFLFDAAAVLHPRLGVSPQIGLSYAF